MLFSAAVSGKPKAKNKTTLRFIEVGEPLFPL